MTGYFVVIITDVLLKLISSDLAFVVKLGIV